jgi:hypothetical protein
VELKCTQTVTVTASLCDALCKSSLDELRWAGSFLSSFFSFHEMVKTTYHSFADEGGCDQLMAKTIAEDLSPVPTDGPGIGDVTGNADKAVLATGMARAAAYAASRALVQPMKSSVYRSLAGKALGASEAAGKRAPQALVVGSAAHGLWQAASGAYNGTCH